MDQPLLLTIAAEGHPLIDLDNTVFIQTVLFLVMALLATKLLFKPYLKMREDRAEGIEGAREEAVRMTAEADARLADYETQLARARSRAREEQRKIHAEAGAHEREVTDKARAEAQKSLAEARETIRGETDAARKELMPKADALAADIAEQLLGRKVS